MLRRNFYKALLALSLGAVSLEAQVYVHNGPPRGIVERPSRRPGARYVWVGGYYRWHRRGYVWVPGRWVIPPRRGYTIWVPGSWVRRPRGWVWVEGRWR